MTVHLTCVSNGADFQIGPDMGERDQVVADQLHERCSETRRPGREQVECRAHDDDPRFADRRDPARGRVHGIYVYLRKLHEGTRAEKWVIAHFDGTAAHHVPVGEGDEHKRLKHEWGTAGAAPGYPVDVDCKRLSNGAKPDVLIHGPAVPVGVEVQRYHLKLPSAQGRNRKLVAGGVTPLWSADRLTAWNERNTIPNVRTNELDELHTPRDEWVVVGGARLVHAQLCAPRYGAACPVKGRGRFCGKYHPVTEPMPNLRVYDVAERLPAGDLVVRDTGRGGRIVVTVSGAQLWDELTAGEPTTRPMDQTTVAPGTTTQCQYEPAPGFDMVLDRRSRERVDSTAPDVRPRCTRCDSRDTTPVLGRGWFCAAHSPRDSS